jgi:hypothetical protein
LGHTLAEKRDQIGGAGQGGVEGVEQMIGRADVAQRIESQFSSAERTAAKVAHGTDFDVSQRRQPGFKQGPEFKRAEQALRRKRKRQTALIATRAGRRRLAGIDCGHPQPKSRQTYRQRGAG